MTADRRRAVASWVLAVLAMLALAAGGLLRYAEHTAFRSDPFADRVEQALERPAVQAAVARRLSDAVVGARPNLVAVRPLIVVAAEGVVGTPAFRALMRRAALDAHRSAFVAGTDTPSLRVRDAGVLVAEALRAIRPELVPQVPAKIRVGVGRITGRVDGVLLDAAQRAQQARRWAPIAFVIAFVLAAGAVLVSRSRRAGVLRLGCALIAVAGVVLLGCASAPGAAASGLAGLDDAAIRAIAAVWVDPLTAWAAAAALVGFVI